MHPQQQRVNCSARDLGEMPPILVGSPSAEYADTSIPFISSCEKMGRELDDIGTMDKGSRSSNTMSIYGCVMGVQNALLNAKSMKYDEHIPKQASKELQRLKSEFVPQPSWPTILCRKHSISGLPVYALIMPAAADAELTKPVGS